ncbi:hypothetical protein BP6252_07980 [Coleophoma cylindrospora]|uniref:Uncharacterized protein n=1 Tax=Coleophoma cylindrospora TaxID=1849047 RepID=A0A3D8RBI8_9HELO|nr:hypothetical protein BP6252_07980 [Coleophoma cylindrospora]
MTATVISPPSVQQLLLPLLSSLPTAAVAPSPPTALLPILSPILRQRVQLLSQGSPDPWLSLLCYDSAKAAKLQEVVKSDRFEPHPVSGEVEVDWDSDVEVRYKRQDEETLHALVALREMDLAVKCVWCTGDQEGGGDGWRIGEVKALEDSEGEELQKSIAEAEVAFKAAAAAKKDGYLIIQYGEKEVEEEEDDDDDDYWAQYDNTPARTPAPQHSPAPTQQNGASAGDEDSYYAQYASVQPAMDNHDPDEEIPEGVETSLGPQDHPHASEMPEKIPDYSYETMEPALSAAELAHPRPGSSSSGEDTVAKLEKEAAREVESREETGIKQHIGTSIKSLYRLARVAGIERSEFDRLVKTELECLALMDEDD